MFQGHTAFGLALEASMDLHGCCTLLDRKNMAKTCTSLRQTRKIISIDISVSAERAFLTLKDPAEFGRFRLCPKDVVLNIHETKELSGNIHQVLLQETKPNLSHKRENICIFCMQLPKNRLAGDFLHHHVCMPVAAWQSTAWPLLHPLAIPRRVHWKQVALKPLRLCCTHPG